jgi:glycosyltransferase involved in cell wall biosynthesis
VNILVEAVLRLNRRGLLLKLDIYGPFLAERPAYRKHVDGFKHCILNKISECDNIRYCGVCPVNDVAGVLKAYDMFAFPTMHETEGFPGVLIDAAFAALPVIASDISSAREIVQHGHNGLIFPMGNAEALADRLAELCDDRQACENLGLNNWEASAQYDVRRCAQQILSCLA